MGALNRTAFSWRLCHFARDRASRPVGEKGLESFSQRSKGAKGLIGSSVLIMHASGSVLPTHYGGNGLVNPKFKIFKHRSSRSGKL
jgi:hypothetical protein